MSAEKIFDAEGVGNAVEGLELARIRLFKLAEILDLSASELQELEDNRASNKGALRDAYEVLLNTLLQLLIQDLDYRGVYELFGKTEPIFTDFICFLKNPPKEATFLIYQLASELDFITSHWKELFASDQQSRQGNIAKQAFERIKFYLLKQLSSKLGEGIHLDEDVELKAYFEELYDNDKKLVTDLTGFVRKYGVRQRVAKHTLQLKGPVSIEHLRAHFQKVKHLPYMTREPIEDRNLRLLELLDGAKGVCVFELSPPFYANEDDFIVRCSYYDGKEWIVSSYFLPLGIDGLLKMKKAHEFFTNLFNDQAALENLSGDIYAKKIMHTSRKHSHADSGKQELLDIFSNVFVLQSDKSGQEIQDAILNALLENAYGLTNPLELLRANDHYVVQKIEDELMPNVEKFVGSTILSLFDGEVALNLEKFADAFGVVVHSAVATLLPLEQLKKRGYSKEDITVIRNGEFLKAAAEGGRSVVNQLAGTLSTGRLETDYSSSCENSEDTFSPTTDTRGWLSSESTQHIDGVGDFAKVTKINPRNTKERVVFYRCNHCGEASIDACAVKKGCQNTSCRASYSEIVSKAQKAQVITPGLEGIKERSVSRRRTEPVIKPVESSHSTGDGFFRGALNLLTFGLAERVGEG